MFFCLGLNAIAWISRNDKNSSISLACAGNHVFDKVLMSGCIDNSKVIFWCIKASVRKIDGDSSFLLLLQVVHDECEFKALLAQLFCFLLELSHALLINIARIVHQPADCRALSMIDMTNEY